MGEEQTISEGLVWESGVRVIKPDSNMTLGCGAVDESLPHSGH